jgi:hypothetical protein
MKGLDPHTLDVVIPDVFDPDAHFCVPVGCRIASELVSPS